jgi:hypothetical protein
MGSLGESGNDSVRLMMAGTTFLLWFCLGTRQTDSARRFLLEFFLFPSFGGHDFILRRHRMIPISGRKDFRFASTFFLSLVGSATLGNSD